MSNDHPGLPFVQAKGYTRGRPDGPALWQVLHDMEASEFSGRAESTAAYFANPSDGRQVSAHFCVDDNSVVQCVDEDDSAWTVGNRPGNNRGVNWELSGFARQSRAEWLDAFGIAMFAQLAPIMAASMRRWGIPNRWCTIDDLLARRPGLTTHNDLRIAFGVTTHTDPGPDFPRDHLLKVVAAALNNPEDDMPKYLIEVTPTGVEQVVATTGVHWWRVAKWGAISDVFGEPFPTRRVSTADLNATFGQLVTAPTPGGGLTYEQAVKAAEEGANLAEDS